MQNEHHHEGSNKPTYNFIFVILAVLTVIELFAASADFLGDGAYVVLGGLAIGKAALVVAYYMHLKNDPPIYTWIFVGAVLTAVALVLSLQGLTGY